MKLSSIIFVLNSVFFLSSAEDSYVDNTDSVVLVNLLFRHGDRTPVDPYPNDPYKNISFWPQGLGQLTDIGKEQHFRFGQLVRERYKNLLPSVYNLRDVLVRSTDVDRTLMSAESHLAGLYPPTTPWEPSLPWQPIPVHTVPEKHDSVVAMKRLCPRYEKEFKRMMNSPELQRINEKHKDLYDYLSKHAGKEIREPIQLQYVYNNLYIESLKNLTLPDWTKSVFPDKMKDLSAFSFALGAYTKELKRLKGGPLLGDMIKHMQEKSRGKLEPDRKLFIYSAHDTTVANFLNTLGVFDIQTPPYTAAVFVQLHHSTTGDFFVSVLYRNDSSRAPYPLRLPGCSVQCPLEQFVRLTKPVVPEDWESECGLRSEDREVEDALLLQTLLIIAMVSAALLALLLVALAVLAILYHQQKLERPKYQLLRTDGP